MIHLSETDSTNSWLRRHADSLPPESLAEMPACGGCALPALHVVWTDHQTAGRGCGTNSWESEAGMNLLFSVLCRPKTLAAAQQFLLLEAMALSVKDVIDPCLPAGDEVKIKWPNDIYWRDCKLGGTLTECALSGQQMRWCIIGTGLNINQTAFSGTLPNPVSLAQITGVGLPLLPLLKSITSCFALRLGQLEQGRSEELQAEYLSALYRRSGFHPYRDSVSLFDGEVAAVGSDGTLTLRDRKGNLRRYRFKELQFVR